MLSIINKVSFIISILFFSSCSMIMAPSITPYHFTEKAELKIVPAIAIDGSAEVQLAGSLSKHIFAKSGYRYQRSYDPHIYGGYIRYSSYSGGIGFYAWIGKLNYLQYDMSCIGGATTELRTFADRSSYPISYQQQMSMQGGAISAVFTHYIEETGRGWGLGFSTGRIDRKIKTISAYSTGFTLIPPKPERINTYYGEIYFSLFKIYKNHNSFSFSTGVAFSKDLRSPFFGKLSFQFPIYLKGQPEVKVKS